MNIEKWIVAHFSPTGGTKKVADAIAAGFGTPVVEMDLTKADASVTLGEKDALMAVLPVYAGRVPPDFSGAVVCVEKQWTESCCRGGLWKQGV